MKRIYIVSMIVILILGGIFVSLFPSKTTGKTIEEAIEKSGRHIVKIVYREKVNDGEVVFFHRGINGAKDYTIDSGYVKKNLWGWEWIYGGGHSEPGQSITGQYFPTTKETPFPLAFGQITNSGIVRVSVQTENGPTNRETRIVENGTTRIWFVFLNPSDGPLTKVIGYAQNREIIDSRDLGTGLCITKKKANDFIKLFFAATSDNTPFPKPGMDKCWGVVRNVLG